jgi:E3 Ubiquitin ligase
VGCVPNYSLAAEPLILSKLTFPALMVSSQDPTHFVVWCVIGIGIGLYLFFKGFRLLRRKRLILDTPASKIRSAAMGMVELSGLATGPYTITAPVTERACYYFRTIIWEWKQQGRNRNWVKVAAESVHVPFFLDDNTGKVLVDPRGAELDLHRDFQQEFCDSFFTMKEEVPSNVREFLLRHGISTTNKIKVEEFCIKPKNALFLLGTLAENSGIAIGPEPLRDEEFNTLRFDAGVLFTPVRSGGGLNMLSFPGARRATFTARRSVSEELFGGSSPKTGIDESGLASSDLAKSIMAEEAQHAASAQVIRLSTKNPPIKTADMTQQQRIVAALSKAGISNPAAWAAAGINASSMDGKSNQPIVASVDSSTDGFESNPPVVIKKGTNDSTFLISWRSQREIASSLGWKCALMIWGGPALSLLCLYLLLSITRVI